MVSSEREVGITSSSGKDLGPQECCAGEGGELEVGVTVVELKMSSRGLHVQL